MHLSKYDLMQMDEDWLSPIAVMAPIRDRRKGAT
jgi:hypothetical protein